MALQIAARSPAGALPARFAKDVGVQCALNQERQRRADHVRGVLLRATLGDQRLIGLFQLRLRHRQILTFLRDRHIFHILVFQDIGFWRVAVNHRNIAFRAGNFRFRFKQYAALIVLYFADEIRIDQEAAVRHHRVATRNLERRKGRGAERQRFSMNDVLRREAKALQILCRIIHAHRTHRANHDHVLRLAKALAQTDRASVLRRRVLRLPVRARTGIPAGNWHVVENAGESQPLIHRRGIQERFDVRTNLTQRLGRAVKFALVEIEPANQRHHGTVLRIDGDQRRVDVRHLRQPPGITDLTDPDLLSGLYHIGHFTWRRALKSVRAVRTRPADTLHAQRNGCAIGHHRHRFLWIGLGDDRRTQRAIGRQRFQGISDFFTVPCAFPHFPQHVGRAAIAVTHIVIHHVITHRLLGSLLHFAGHGGIDAITIFIRFITVATHHLLANHFSKIRCRESDFRRMVIGINNVAARLIVLRLADIAFAQHTRQHHVTACGGAVQRVERVKRGWRFWQAGNGRHFAQRELIDRLTKIDLSRSPYAIGAVAQIDLVEVKLKDLVFAQQLLNADREEYLFDLTHQRLFRAKEEVTRQLLGNGTCPLRGMTGEQRHACRTENTDRIDTVVLVKTAVLGGDKSLHHHGWNLI